MALADTLEQLQNFDINDIDWDRIGVWPLPARIAVCAVLVIAILCGVYFMVIEDLNLQKDRVVAEEGDLRKAFETKSFQAANLEAYRQQMAEMEESFGALVKQLPSDTEVPGLLEDIDEKGTESNLVIDSIDLRPEKVGEFYVELPIDIKVNGSYHDLGAFVSGVAGMPRIATLHNYSITEKDGRLAMSIGAKTYRYKSQEE